MRRRRPVTNKVRAAARRNLTKAHITRFRTRESRSIGRATLRKLRGLGRLTRPIARTRR